MFTPDWIGLDEEWQQRSQQMFQRFVKESDKTKARRAWDAFCQSEKMRGEWKDLCLQDQKRVGTSAAIAREISNLHWA